MARAERTHLRLISSVFAGAPTHEGGRLLRIALVGLALGSAGATCNGAHDTPPVVRESCVSCHQADYEATSEPVHRSDPQLYHRECIDCHAVQSWSPALKGPHPEEAFVTKGTSHDYPCLDCHDFQRGESSEKGADTDCVGCHDGAHTPTAALGRHRAIPSFEIEEYVPGEPPWCMECHTGGRGFGKNVPHPEADFPITRAPHDYECQECHDTTRGRTLDGNTNCTGCHDDDAHVEAIEADNHREVPAYRWDALRPDFCLDCHSQPEPALLPNITSSR
jgi:nitrate/TMAO reductase-like tetraheme cytochrome c subunit